MIETKWGQVLIINQKQCRSLITDEEAYALTEKVLSDHDKGTAINPLKVHMPFYPEYNAYINAMPSWLKEEKIAGIKWAAIGENNPGKYGLPQSTATAILSDLETGYPVAFMDSTTIMSLRTGAVAGIMAKYCAKSTASVVTIIGAGVQGSSGLKMTLIGMPQIKEVRFVDIRQAAIDRAIARFSAEYPQVSFSGTTDIQEGVNGTDIIITAVHAPGDSGMDMLDNIDMPEGVTLVEIAGGVSPEKIREKFDWSVMDNIEAYLHRMNDQIPYMKEIFGIEMTPMTPDMADAEIGAIINGRQPGRRNDKERVRAAAIGMSIEDIILAKKIYDRAKAGDIGMVVDIINGEY